MSIAQAWDSYWAYVGGNIAAIPLEFIVTGLTTLLFRKHIAKAVKWFRDQTASELHEHLSDLRADIAALHARLDNHPGAADRDAGQGSPDSNTLSVTGTEDP